MSTSGVTSGFTYRLMCAQVVGTSYTRTAMVRCGCWQCVSAATSESTRYRHKGRPRAGRRGQNKTNKRVLGAAYSPNGARFHVWASQARLAREEVVADPSPLPPPDVFCDDRDPMAEISAAQSDQVAEVVLRMLDWMGAM